MFFDYHLHVHLSSYSIPGFFSRTKKMPRRKAINMVSLSYSIIHTQLYTRNTQIDEALSMSLIASKPEDINFRHHFFDSINTG